MRTKNIFWIAIYGISALLTILSYNTFVFRCFLLNFCVAIIFVLLAKKQKRFVFVGHCFILINIFLYVPALHLKRSPFRPYVDDKFKVLVETAKRDNRHIFAVMESSFLSAHKSKEQFNPSHEFWKIVNSNKWLADQHMQIYLINTNMSFWKNSELSPRKPYVAKMISCQQVNIPYYVFITGDLTEGISTNQPDLDLAVFCIKPGEETL
jgi:hypothetical protein